MDDIESIRTRPGMYIGGCNINGLTNMTLRPLIEDALKSADSSIDQVCVRLKAQRVFEVEIRGKMHVPEQFVSFRLDHSFEASALIAIALCESAKLEVMQEGARFTHSFERGGRGRESEWRIHPSVGFG